MLLQVDPALGALLRGDVGIEWENWLEHLHGSAAVHTLLCPGGVPTANNGNTSFANSISRTNSSTSASSSSECLLIAPPQQLLEPGGALPELFILAELHSTTAAPTTNIRHSANSSGGSKLRVSVVRQFGGVSLTAEQRRALSLLVNQLLHWCWQTELALPLNRSPAAH
jgi:hypothetical protein